MDNNQTESIGTVAPELRMDLQSLLQKNCFEGLSLSDFVSFVTETQSPPSPITVHPLLLSSTSLTRILDWRPSGLTGRANGIALFAQLLASSPSQPSLTKKMVCVLSLLLLNDTFRNCQAEMLIETESWLSSTTAVSSRQSETASSTTSTFLPSERVQPLPQREDAISRLLADSAFAPLFPVVATFIESDYSISNNYLLQYSVFFMEEDVGFKERSHG